MTNYQQFKAAYTAMWGERPEAEIRAVYNAWVADEKGREVIDEMKREM